MKFHRKRSAGFALGEMLLAVAIVAVLIGIGAAVYGNLRGGITADDQAAKTISLVADIQKNYRNAGSYTTLSPSEIDKLKLIPKPLRFDGTNILDAYGNAMSVSGGTTTFALTIGGTTNVISNSDCAAIANRLGAGVATNVGSTINQTNLTAGCNQANPVIASMFQ